MRDCRVRYSHRRSQLCSGWARAACRWQSWAAASAATARHGRPTTGALRRLLGCPCGHPRWTRRAADGCAACASCCVQALLRRLRIRPCMGSAGAQHTPIQQSLPWCWSSSDACKSACRYAKGRFHHHEDCGHCFDMRFHLMLKSTLIIMASGRRSGLLLAHVLGRCPGHRVLLYAFRLI